MPTPYLHKDAPLYAEAVAATGLDPLEIGVSPFAGMEPVLDPTIPKDEVHIVDDEGETVGVIKIPDVPEKPVAKKAPAARPATKRAVAKKTTPPIKKRGQ